MDVLTYVGALTHNGLERIVFANLNKFRCGQDSSKLAMNWATGLANITPHIFLVLGAKGNGYTL